ncbi:YolD-like family protein [Fictibacillus sp. S7]|uniref:YolD-like family protein n=1 Tax=Fictibacillus sp. S7 TaxID=2212476 RepID=UPI001F519098|nr:YolD-like family protein [Fictibacillus sp. S7]
MKLIRDRGKMKWQGMLMPEHVKKIKEFDWNDSKKKKPELDEQQVQVMEDTICDVMAANQYLCLTYFNKDDFHLMIGKVHYIDPVKRNYE